MKPCQMDWQKLVVLEKCILLKRILVISLKIKQNEKLTCLYYLLFLFFFLIFEFWDGKQNSVPYMWKIILVYVPIEDGVADCYR